MCVLGCHVGGFRRSCVAQAIASAVHDIMTTCDAINRSTLTSRWKMSGETTRWRFLCFCSEGSAHIGMNTEAHKSFAYKVKN